MSLRVYTDKEPLRLVVSAMLEVLDREAQKYEGGFEGEMRRSLKQHRGVDYLGWSPTTRFYYHAKDDVIYRGRQKGRIGKEEVDVRDLPGDIIDDPRDYKPEQGLPAGFEESVLKELTSPKLSGCE